MNGIGTERYIHVAYMFRIVNFMNATNFSKFSCNYFCLKLFKSFSVILNYWIV